MFLSDFCRSAGHLLAAFWHPRTISRFDRNFESAHANSPLMGSKSAIRERGSGVMPATGRRHSSATMPTAVYSSKNVNRTAWLARTEKCHLVRPPGLSPDGAIIPRLYSRSGKDGTLRRAVLFTQNQRGNYGNQIRADVNVESTNDYLGSLFAARPRNRAK